MALGQRVAMAHKILALAKTEGQEPSLTLLEQEVDSFVVDKRFALDMAGLYRSFEEFELARRLVECLAYELPNDSSVLLALSIAEGEAGHVTEELRLLKELIKGVNSVGAMPQLRLSQAYERQGRLAEALYWANQGLQIDDSNGQLSYQAARINASLGATKPSRDLLGNAISINTSYRGRAHADEVFALLFRVDG